MCELILESVIAQDFRQLRLDAWVREDLVDRRALLRRHLQHVPNERLDHVRVNGRNLFVISLLDEDSQAGEAAIFWLEWVLQSAHLVQ